MSQEDVHTVTTPMSSPKLSAEPSTHGVRRSSRTKKGIKKFEEEAFVLSPSKPAVKDVTTTKNTTRPKRKAAIAAAEVDTTEDGAVLLDQILVRMAEDERKEYKGWVEVESEPGFFNAMLHQLGAQDFKMQELFGLDEFSRGLLPKPVYGLIYLSQYIDQTTTTTIDRGRQDCPSHLWFGNQTTTNACATVALMNIIMNATDMTLGLELQDFKGTTQPLVPALRGNMLDKNDFIRSIHNSVARRTDLVAEDLVLDNSMEAADNKRRNQGRRKPARANKSRGRSVPEQTFHYIAYVHVGGEVWELDGFEIQPLCLGPSPEDNWLEVASEAIQQKMLVNEDLQCSLLAVCQSPLRRIISDLATNEALFRKLATILEKTTKYATASEPLARDPARATVVDTASENVKIDPTLLADINVGKFSQEELEGMTKKIQSRQDTLMAEYSSEMVTRNEGHEMMNGRQQDYTPAVHRWIQILAEKGLLRELIKEMESELNAAN